MNQLKSQPNVSFEKEVNSLLYEPTTGPAINDTNSWMNFFYKQINNGPPLNILLTWEHIISYIYTQISLIQYFRYSSISISDLFPPAAAYRIVMHSGLAVEVVTLFCTFHFEFRDWNEPSTSVITECGDWARGLCPSVYRLVALCRHCNRWNEHYVDSILGQHLM